MEHRQRTGRKISGVSSEKSKDYLPEKDVRHMKNKHHSPLESNTIEPSK